MKKWKKNFFGLLVLVLSLVVVEKVNAENITISQLVNVINNGQNTKDLKSEGYSEITANINNTNIVVNVVDSSGAVSQVIYTYDSTTNMIKYNTTYSTESEGVAKMKFATALMNWVYEASPQYNELLKAKDSYSGPQIDNNICDLTNKGMCLNTSDGNISLEMELSDKVVLYLIAYYNSNSGQNNSMDPTTNNTTQETPVDNAQTGSFVDYITIAGLGIIGVSVVVIALKNKKVYKI